MGRMTFVFEFEDGKEPEINTEMEFMDGKIIAASNADLVSVVMNMDNQIDSYKKREKNLIDKLNYQGEPLTRKEMLLFLVPVFAACLLSLFGIIFGIPALISVFNRWFDWW